MNGYKFSQQRKAKGISQMLLAKISGISRYKISLFENDYLSLNVADMRKLQSALAKNQGGYHAKS